MLENPWWSTNFPARKLLEQKWAIFRSLLKLLFWCAKFWYVRMLVDSIFQLLSLFFFFWMNTKLILYLISPAQFILFKYVVLTNHICLFWFDVRIYEPRCCLYSSIPLSWATCTQQQSFRPLVFYSLVSSVLFFANYRPLSSQSCFVYSRSRFFPYLVWY